MLITEKFPETYFRDWDPTGTWGTPAAPHAPEAAHPPEQDDAALERTVGELEHFLRTEVLGNHRHEPIPPDAALIESGLIDATGFFALLGFIAERYGVKFDDEELVPDNFRTLAGIARRVAERRAPRRPGA
jgi:acyl carrier protein